MTEEVRKKTKGIQVGRTRISVGNGTISVGRSKVNPADLFVMVLAPMFLTLDYFTRNLSSSAQEAGARDHLDSLAVIWVIAGLEGIYAQTATPYRKARKARTSAAKLRLKEARERNASYLQQYSGQNTKRKISDAAVKIVLFTAAVTIGLALIAKSLEKGDLPYLKTAGLQLSVFTTLYIVGRSIVTRMMPYTPSRGESEREWDADRLAAKRAKRRAELRTAHAAASGGRGSIGG